MTVDATLLLIAPEMADIAQATRTSVAALAALEVGSPYGDKQELATAYLTAHMLTLSQRNGNAGRVTTVKEGDLSISYSAGKDTGSLNATSYGQEFMRIKKTALMAARTRAV